MKLTWKRENNGTYTGRVDGKTVIFAEKNDGAWRAAFTVPGGERILHTDPHPTLWGATGEAARFLRERTA